MSGLFERLEHGISVLDTGFVRPRFDAAYLIVEDGKAAIIDTGTNHSVPRLLQSLVDHALEPADVQWVVLTHIHLDHAGGAGLLLRHLLHAQIVVHPRGARHLSDPSRLMAGARAVYGDAIVLRDYGELVAVPPERIVTTTDDMVLHLGQRPLRVIDTPGHARHHHCIWDEASRGCFVGDTLGVAYQELRCGGAHYGFPSTTPTQFEPPALKASIARLLRLRPQTAFLTHYGAVHQVEVQAELVLRQIDPMVALACAERGAALREGLAHLYFNEARRQGLVIERAAFEDITAGDIELNAAGLEAWRSTQEAAR